MNVLIEIVHPAHFYYYRDTIANLKRDGHKVIMAIVTKYVLEEVVQQSGVEYVNICRKPHKKYGKIGVAYDMVMRDMRMLWLALRYRADIITGSTIETAHIGWLLRKPNINIGEDDAAVVMKYIKQIKPFVGVRLTPDCCDNGPIEAKSIHFPGYYKTAYLRPGYFSADTDVPSKYGIDTSKPYFLIRFSALNAHHDKGIKGINTEIAERLVKILEPFGRIYITSERPLEPQFEQYRIKINPLDMHHVMAFASLYIGDSQTMAAEAGVLGVPFARFNDFVGRIGYLRELEDQYELGYGIKASSEGSVDKLCERVKTLVTMRSEERKSVFQARRQKMLSDKIDCAKFLTWFIEHYPESAEEARKADGVFWAQFK
jgi:predicted glycosyltransferase